jgi:signal transduction histidine kinase
MTQWTLNKIILRFVTTALLLCASVQACATDNRNPDWVKLEVLVDETLSKNLEDVTKSAFSPFDARQKLPFSQSVVWLRLRQENAIGKGQVLFLKVLPTLISEITVYTPTAKSLNGWEIQSYKTEQLSKPIPIGSTALGKDIYVRVSTPLDLRILPLVDTKENIDSLQRISEAYIVSILTILSLASALTLARLVIRFNSLSLFLFTFFACITTVLLVGTDLLSLIVKSDIDYKLDTFPVALSGAVFSIICIWLLLAYELFNGGIWIKAAFIFLLIFGLIFVGSFFNGNKAIVILENVKNYASSILIVLLFLQTLKSKHLLVKTSEKLTLILLIVFSILSLPTSGDFYQPLIEAFNGDNLKTASLLILLRPLLSLMFLTLAVWNLENLRSERISSLKSELNITKSNLESESSRLSLQKKFTAMLTHELKNPLMASQMALGSIRDRLGDEDPSIPRVDSIQHSLQEIDSIIERCAEIDKYEQGYIPLVMEKFPLGDLVCIMKASHPSERIYTIVRGTDENLVFRSDLYYIKSILNNLLTNALKYSVAESLVELKIEYKRSTFNNELLFSVSNEVTDDAKMDSTRVFDRYYRSESAKQQSGAGLGLWLAQSMAHALGSDIKLKTDRQFVRFEFSIHV